MAPVRDFCSIDELLIRIQTWNSYTSRKYAFQKRPERIWDSCSRYCKVRFSGAAKTSSVASARYKTIKAQRSIGVGGIHCPPRLLLKQSYVVQTLHIANRECDAAMQYKRMHKRYHLSQETSCITHSPWSLRNDANLSSTRDTSSGCGLTFRRSLTDWSKNARISKIVGFTTSTKSLLNILRWLSAWHS